jgi:hypothetical protein
MTKKQLLNLSSGDRVEFVSPGAEDNGVTGIVRMGQEGFYIQWADGEKINITAHYKHRKLAHYLKKIRE